MMKLLTPSTWLVIGLCAVAVAACEEVDYSRDNIGRDAGSGDEIVRQFRYSVTYPSGTVLNEMLIEASASYSSRLTCRDEDGNSEQDVFCPVSFRVSGTVSYDDRPMGHEGIIDVALFLSQIDTPIGISRDLRWTGSLKAGVTLSSDAQLNDAMRRLIGPRIRYGIVLNLAPFQTAREAGLDVPFLRQRFAELVAHEFVHLGGLSGHPPQDRGICDAVTVEHLMCGGGNFTRLGAPIQQFKVSEDICEVLYRSENYGSSKIHGLQEMTITVGNCE